MPGGTVLSEKAPAHSRWEWLQSWPGLALIAALTLLCFAADHVLGQDPFIGTDFASWGLYLFALLGLLAHAASLALRPRPRFDAALAGALWISGLGSLLIGLVLSPISLISLLFGIGILGFIPFLVAKVLLGQAVALTRRSRLNGLQFLLAAGLGAGSIFAGPFFAARAENAWLESHYSRLESSDSTLILASLRVLSGYPLCRRSCIQRVCASPAADDRAAEVQTALRRLVGDDVDLACSMALD